MCYLWKSSTEGHKQAGGRQGKQRAENVRLGSLQGVSAVPFSKQPQIKLCLKIVPGAWDQREGNAIEIKTISDLEKKENVK